MEDSFKFATSCMGVYSLAINEQRDHSVELYVLNYWIKDFTLRDLIDRVSVVSLDDKQFLPLFSWLMTSRLNAPTQDYSIEDFRKLAL